MKGPFGTAVKRQVVDVRTDDTILRSNAKGLRIVGKSKDSKDPQRGALPSFDERFSYR